MQNVNLAVGASVPEPTEAYEPPVLVLLGNARDLLAGGGGSFPTDFNPEVGCVSEPSSRETCP